MTAVHAPDELLLGFTRALRSAGVRVTSDRAQTFLRAVAVVGLGNRSATYWAGRSTLCSDPDDFGAFDQVFTGWFEEEAAGGGRRIPPPAPREVSQAPLGEDDPTGRDGDPADVLRVSASDVEVLRHRDIATLDAAERLRLAALLRRLEPQPPRRSSYRRAASPRGAVDPYATLRRTLRQLGEPVEIARRRRSTSVRRVVLLVDVSGSMSTYADALLRLAHRVTQGSPRSASTGSRGLSPRVEVFSVGTRVTRLTPALRQRDADRALTAAGRTVPDWSGGTRLGEGLKVFLDRWGQRGLARGAVVVVFSDGWERGDAALLGEQMARLHRLAHRVVWVNPHKGAEGYRPVQAGMAAALPHVDDFVAGHSLAAFQEVLEVMRHA
jgi:uncharacterized protein with von Willebrand factor type A (vWA) domain